MDFSRLKVLIIEDDEDDYVFIRDILSEIEYYGCDVEWVRTFDAAREELSRCRHDLYLLDYRLGKHNGLDLLLPHKANGLVLNAPVVLLTGQGDRRIDIEAMNAGASDYLDKSRINAALLERAIRYALARKSAELKLLELNRTLVQAHIERDDRERELRESEQKYRNFFESATEGIFNATPDGVFLDVNPAFARIFGFSSPRRLLDSGGRLCEQLHFDPEESRRLRRLLESRGAVQGFETILCRKDGRRIYVKINARAVRDPEGAITRYDGSVEDVTGRVQDGQAIQALFESTVRSIGQEFLDTIVEVLCGWLGCEYAMVGEIVDETYVKPLSMHFDCLPVQKSFYSLAGGPCEAVVKTGYINYPEGVCALFPDHGVLGKIGAVGYVGTPLRNRAGETIGILCAVSRKRLDLPRRTEQVIGIIAARASAEIERVRMDQERRRIEGQLRQAQKMQAIGTLAGGIAHDFNNILGIILGFTDLTMLTLPKDSPEYANLYEVREASLRARDLITQILSFSRVAEQKRRPFRISLIVKEVLKLLKAALPSSIVIQFEQKGLNEGFDNVLADPTQIHQVLMNLSSNAAHAMRERGGSLSVALSHVHIPEGAGNLPVDLKPGSYVKLAVSDTGHGIDSETMEHIFEPYFTTKKQGEGTGLGLAVVHGIVESHGGAIGVTSKPGLGTTFDIYLPVLRSAAADEVKSPRSVLTGGTEHVLLVDDEEGLIRAGSLMLEYLGYTVTARKSGTEALETFRAQPDRFDLVITDLTMPKMPGTELARELLRIRSDMPVILCTGFTEIVNSESVRAVGIKEFIAKPLALESLAKVVRKVLDERGA